MRNSLPASIRLLGVSSALALCASACSSSKSSGDDAGPPLDSDHDSGHHDAGKRDAKADAKHADGAADAHHRDAGEHDGAKDAKGDGAAEVKEAYHLIGRWDTSKAATPTSLNAVAEWPGSGVLATFTGANIGVDVLETPNASGDHDSLAVEVDGAYLQTFALDSTNTGCVMGECKFLLLSGLATGMNHTVAIYKTTDSFYGGKVTFKSFIPAANGAIVSKLYTFPHRIEFIGDDIAAGRGAVTSGVTTAAQCTFVDGAPGIPNAASSEYDSFAALVAMQFGAERYNLSISNAGVFEGNGSAGQLLPTVYGQVLPSEPTSKWKDDPAAASWKPDLVVVNLGGYGDFANTADSLDSPLSAADTMFETSFESAYETFLKAVRAAHPNAFILVVSGNGYAGDVDPMVAPTLVSAVVTDLQAHGETALTMGFYAAAVSTTSSDYTCSYYPNLTDQQAMAMAVATQITTLVSW